LQTTGECMTDEREQNLAAGNDDAPDNADKLRQEFLAEINRLGRFANRGILALSLFLAVSILAWWGFVFLPAPEAVTAVLGKPPSPRIISIALLIYTFSAIILSLARMTTGIEHRSSFSHVGYLTVFFLFYYFARSLEENYWAVFGAGITILGVESYRIWTYCSEVIARKKEDVAYLSRTGKPPPPE
jgi:hypothetical protein